MTETRPPLLSILVPAWNAAPYLEECIASALDQGAGDIEILICDDYSSDGTRELAHRIAKREPRIVRVLENAENAGPSFTRNRLVDAARGEYLWFLDADDWLLPGAIAAVRDTISGCRPDIVSFDYRKGRMYKHAFKGPSNNLLTDHDKIIGGVCGSRKMYAWLKVSRRDLWDESLRFPVGKLFEDAALTPWLLLRASSFVHLPKALVHYRTNAASIMGRINKGTSTFRHDANRDLAHALDGFAEALDGAGIAADGKARVAVGHFLAMEFHKIVRRIRQAGPEGTGREDIAGLANEFRKTMEGASPVPFAGLKANYLRHGRFIAWFQLSRALAACSD